MTRRRLSRWLLAAVVVVAGCATMTSSAGASFGIQSFEAHYSQGPLTGEMPGPPDFQAGSHPYEFTTNIVFNTTKNAKGETVPDGFAKNVQVRLPQGMAGSVNGIPRCPMALFSHEGALGEGETCPADTQVGVIAVGEEEAPLFNLVPPEGVNGQIGAILVLVPLVINLSVGGESDHSMTAELVDISQLAEPKEISTSLWGVPADSRHTHLRRCPKGSSSSGEGSCPSGAPLEPLLTMPTSCGEPLTATLVAESWENPNVSVERSVTANTSSGAPGEVAGCKLLAFDPSIVVQPESSAADTPTGLSVDVSLPDQGTPEGLAEADLKNIVVTFPGGLSINAATGGGLTGCSPDQIGLGEPSAPQCPDTSKVGAFEMETPISSNALKGSVYLAQPVGEFEGVMDVYLTAEADGLDIKLPAQLSAQPDSGQLTFTLNNAPKLPLSKLNIDLFGGPRATIANSSVCQAFTASAELTPYSAPESSVQARSSDFAVDEGCGGGFAPSFTGGGTSAAAGQGTDFALHVSRGDGQQYLQGLTATLPSGLMANIASATQCGDAEAAAGTCSASSEIGTISVGVGAGPDPDYLNGRVYLTGPYKGAPFGLSMVIPELAGPFDLGTAIIRGSIAFNLSPSNLTITTDPFPTIVRGIPLRIKDINLALDRAGFLVNPTDCAGQAIRGTVSSIEGSDVAVSAPFGVVGCSGLPFAPKLAVTTLAKASSRGDGASFDAKVTNAPGTHANLRSVIINLPKPLKPRLTAIQQACVAATFAANPGACPPASVIGKAVVDTSILGTPMTGPAYLVFHRGIKYPDVVLVLQGSGLSLQLSGSVNIDKGISSTAFSQLPDIPMSLFELDLPEGRNSLLGTSESLCAKPRHAHYTMAGHDGSQSQGADKVTVEGCSGRTAVVGRRHRGGAFVAQLSARAGWRG